MTVCLEKDERLEDLVRWSEGGVNHVVHGTKSSCENLREFFEATAELYEDWLKLARQHDPLLRGVPDYERILTQLTRQGGHCDSVSS